MAERIRAAACEVASLQNRSLSDWLYRVVLDYASERAIPSSGLSETQIVEAVSLRLESLCRHIFDIDLHAVGASGTPVTLRQPDETAQPDRHLLDRAIAHLMERASVEAMSPAAQGQTGPTRRTTASRPTRLDSRQIGPAVAAAVKRHKERGAGGDGGDDLLSLCDEIADTLGAYRARRQRVRESQPAKPLPPRSEPYTEPDLEAELRPSLACSDSASAERRPDPEPVASRSSAQAAEEAPTARTQTILGQLQRQYEDLSIGFSSIRDIHSRVATLDETVKGFMERDERRASELEARAAASAQQALEKVLVMLQAPRVSDEHSGLLRRTVNILDNLTERVDDTARRMSALESMLAEPQPSASATPSAVRPNMKVDTHRDPRHSPARGGPAPARPLKSDGAGAIRRPPVGAGDPAARVRPHAHLGWSLGMGLAASAVAVGGASYMSTPQVLADSPVVALKEADGHEAPAALAGEPDEARPVAGNGQVAEHPAPVTDSGHISRQGDPAAAAKGLEHQDAAHAAALFDEAKTYETGRGVTRDEARAVTLFQEAAELGSTEARFHLGSLFERGVGVPRDLIRARALYRQAANGGHAGAMHNLAVLLFSGGGAADLPAAVSWFQRAAQAGVRDSQYNLGVLYSQGRGVPRSLSEAYRWFALAAGQGDPEAAKKRDVLAAQLSPVDLRSARERVAAFAPDAGGLVTAVAN